MQQTILVVEHRHIPQVDSPHAVLLIARGPNTSIAGSYTILLLGPFGHSHPTTGPVSPNLRQVGRLVGDWIELRHPFPSICRYIFDLEIPVSSLFF